MGKEVLFYTEEEVNLPGRLECPDCHKHYRRLEQCKDGKSRCKHCKRKMVTNIFYTSDKNRYYISKYSVNKQEYNMLLGKYIKQGCSYQAAKKKVEYDLSCLKSNKVKKFMENKITKQNLNMENKKKEELNKDFLRGLGQK